MIANSATVRNDLLFNRRSSFADSASPYCYCYYYYYYSQNV